MSPLFGSSSYFPRHRIKPVFPIWIHKAPCDLAPAGTPAPLSYLSTLPLELSAPVILSICWLSLWCLKSSGYVSPAIPSLLQCSSPGCYLASFPSFSLPQLSSSTIRSCSYTIVDDLNWNVSSRRTAAFLLLLLFIIVYSPCSSRTKPEIRQRRGWQMSEEYGTLKLRLGAISLSSVWVSMARDFCKTIGGAPAQPEARGKTSVKRCLWATSQSKGSTAWKHGHLGKLCSNSGVQCCWWRGEGEEMRQKKSRMKPW